MLSEESDGVTEREVIFPLEVVSPCIEERLIEIIPEAEEVTDFFFAGLLRYVLYLHRLVSQQVC